MLGIYNHVSLWGSVSHSVVSDSLQPHGLDSPPHSSVMEFSRHKYWSGQPLPSGDLPSSGIEPGSPALQADSLPSEPPGKLYRLVMSCLIKVGDEVCLEG